MGLNFEWDPQKATSNLWKHGVSVDDASTVFHDPLALIFDDGEHSENEAREIMIGHSATGMLLLVSFVERAEDGIRIISARATTTRERDDYEENQRH